MRSAGQQVKTAWTLVTHTLYELGGIIFSPTAFSGLLEGVKGKGRHLPHKVMCCLCSL